MPRFAILTHDHPFPHWDFLLEAGPTCRTWRLLAEPGPGRVVPAEPLPDHRPHYLTYEGPVSGGRGAVAGWDRGTFAEVTDQPEVVAVDLDGKRLCGRCVLRAGAAGWSAMFAPAGEPRA